jgi:hypothetical protein
MEDWVFSYEKILDPLLPKCNNRLYAGTCLFDEDGLDAHERDTYVDELLDFWEPRFQKYGMALMERSNRMIRNQIQGFRVNIQANSKSKPFISFVMAPRKIVILWTTSPR